MPAGWSTLARQQPATGHKHLVRFRDALFSEHSEACVIKSSDVDMLSSSSAVSCTLLLFCEKKSFREPLVVTQSRLLLAEFGW